jgi:Protein of unknown function (DUF3187)
MDNQRMNIRRREKSVAGMVRVMLLIAGGVCRGQAGDPDAGEAARDNTTGLGYLNAASMSPGHFLKPSSLFVAPTVGARGTQWLGVELDWANIYAHRPDQYLVDGEWVRSTVRFAQALTETLSAGLAVPMIGRTGGFADSTIDNAHSAMHMAGHSRKHAIRNRSLVVITRDGTAHTVMSGESWGIGDVSAFAVKRVTEGSALWPALDLQSAVSFPTGNAEELRGLGTMSISVSAVASKRLGATPLLASLGLGAAYSDANDVLVMTCRNDQYTGLAGLEYQQSRSFSLLLQYLITSPAARDYPSFSEPTHEVAAGFKWRLGRNSMMELALVENLFVLDNSADVGVHFSFYQKL